MNILYIAQGIIIIIPIYWGLYEFRQFRKQLDQFNLLTNNINKQIKNITKKFDDISSNNLEKYPFIYDIKLLIDKANYYSSSKKNKQKK